MSKCPMNRPVVDERVHELVVHVTPVEATEADGVPTRLLLVPWGSVESRSGSFIVDEESAAAVVEAFAAQGVDLPVDYEHQTLGGEFSSPTGQAPAAGWIQRIEAVEGEGIFAHVAWTPAAIQQLARREYRYLSPVAIVRKSDRKLVGLHSAALTNKPAIVGMRAIVNRQTDPPTEETITMNEKLEALRTAVALDPTAELDVVLVAATERIESLNVEMARRSAEQRVMHAVSAGKLTEAQRDWAVALAMKDHEAYAAWEASAPVVVTPGRTEPPDGHVGVDANRRAVIAKARHEYRSHPELEPLTHEDAYVRDALRVTGLAPATDE